MYTHTNTFTRIHTCTPTTHTYTHNTYWSDVNVHHGGTGKDNLWNSQQVTTMNTLHWEVRGRGDNNSMSVTYVTRRHREAPCVAYSSKSNWCLEM